MGRAKRMKESRSIKKTLYIYGALVIFCTLASMATVTIYNNKVQEELASGIASQRITGLMPELPIGDIFTETASSEINKSIEDAIGGEQDKEVTVEGQEELIEIKEEVNEEIIEEQPIIEEVVIPDPEFELPVEGEISKKYAKENLVFSETLQEWVTHAGIDIRADRTTVVKSAEKGKVIAIKNDPRYGLTIIVEHVNGYKTIYANLLTTEFVSEQEEVEKGQSMGTVGNSAIFEIVDEPHLHFEILKDDISVDPELFLK